MKIRYQAGILAAALSLSVMTMAFAAGSPSTNPRPIGGGGSSSSSGPRPIGGGSYNPGGPGITTIEDGSTPLASGGSGAMFGNTNTGVGVTFTENFGASISDNQIAQVNAGLSTIQSLPSDSVLAGYNPLVRIQNMETTASTDGQPIQFSIYVPNLVEGLNNIQILIQNPSTGKWELVAPTAVSTGTKTVTVSLNYAGPLTVVYKN